jgi:hypothetical protein
VYADERRAFVALQLEDATTAERVWFDHYDYRGISTAMMAGDIVETEGRCAVDPQ